MEIRIAVVDNHVEYAKERKKVIDQKQWPEPVETVVFASAEDFLEACEHTFFDVIITDVFMPGKHSDNKLAEGTPEEGGIRITNWLADKRQSDEDYRQVQLRWITRNSDIRHIIQDYINLGNDAWLRFLPGNDTGTVWKAHFLMEVDRAIRMACPGFGQPQATASGEFVASSPSTIKVMKDAQRIADSNVTVLIRGETGTGKDVLANFILKHSGRRDGAFVTVNCAAITETLLDSELFGHVKGSFTGAIEEKTGKFEAADKGTIFLDEIGDMSPAAQAKVLRILEKQPFEKVGGSKPIDVDVRVLAATNRPLEQMIQAGKFREDLFYRLNAFEFTLPPLRERREDVPELARRFVDRFAREYKRGQITLSNEAAAALKDQNWPGNVRELRNTIERAVLLLPPDRISLEKYDLPGSTPMSGSCPPTELDEVARRRLSVLISVGCNLEKARIILGLNSKQALGNWLADHPEAKGPVDSERARLKQVAKANTSADRRGLPPSPSTTSSTDF